MRFISFSYNCKPLNEHNECACGFDTNAWLHVAERMTLVLCLTCTLVADHAACVSSVLVDGTT
jgi:hypothetical protein